MFQDVNKGILDALGKGLPLWVDVEPHDTMKEIGDLIRSVKRTHPDLVLNYSLPTYINDVINRVAYHEAPTKKLVSELQRKEDILYTDIITKDDMQNLVVSVLEKLPNGLEDDILHEIEDGIVEIVSEMGDELRAAMPYHVKDIVVALDAKIKAENAVAFAAISENQEVIDDACAEEDDSYCPDGVGDINDPTEPNGT
jgi:hypothetical protein